MYEIYIYIVISFVFESGGGMLYGVAVGFDPLLVFAATLTINIFTVFASIFVIDKLARKKNSERSKILEQIRCDWNSRRGVRALADTGCSYWPFTGNSVTQILCSIGRGNST